MSLVSAVMVGAPGAAAAQELVHGFINPSFGGNPFNAEHLLNIANIHRPDQPEEDEEPEPTEQEIIAQQIQSRLLSTLTSNLVSQIQNAQPGQSGEFVLGDQTIRYVRTATETRVTFINNRTNETTELVIPVSGTGGSTFASGAPVLSGEQALADSAARAAGQQALASGNAGNIPYSDGAGLGRLEVPLGPPPL